MSWAVYHDGVLQADVYRAGSLCDAGPKSRPAATHPQPPTASARFWSIHSCRGRGVIDVRSSVFFFSWLYPHLSPHPAVFITHHALIPAHLLAFLYMLLCYCPPCAPDIPKVYINTR